MKSRILVLCTGNSCRSQMAEAILKSFDPELEVFSAGTKPAIEVHPKAVEVIKELGIDISDYRPKLVDKYKNDAFDYVITVCGNAQQNCPVFMGEVKHRLHIGFDDPADAKGTEEEIINEFRRIRDLIQCRFKEFYIDLRKQL